MRKFGLSKEGLIARQVMLGVVQTADGLPLHHEVFDGNTAEVRTLKPTLEKIVQQFPVKRVIAVAGRGFDVHQQLGRVAKHNRYLAGGELEFILGKLDEQDSGKRSRGCKLSDGGARARFITRCAKRTWRASCEWTSRASCSATGLDEQALAHARLMDGQLLLMTNVPVADLAPAQVIQRYKSLADIERGLRVLKSEIEIGPIHHRLPKRIRAHARICFTALILHRVMRSRLRARGTSYSPQQALGEVVPNQHHRVTLLLRPCEVLSGVANAPVLEVAHDALGVLLQHRHVIVGC